MGGAKRKTRSLQEQKSQGSWLEAAGKCSTKPPDAIHFKYTRDKKEGRQGNYCYVVEPLDARFISREPELEESGIEWLHHITVVSLSPLLLISRVFKVYGIWGLCGALPKQLPVLGTCQSAAF